MNSVRIDERIDKIAQINARLTVRSESHDFPLVGIRNETEKSRELGIEQTQRIGPIDRLDVFDAAISRLARWKWLPTRRGHPSRQWLHHRNLNTNTRSRHEQGDGPQNENGLW